MIAKHVAAHIHQVPLRGVSVHLPGIRLIGVAAHRLRATKAFVRKAQIWRPLLLVVRPGAPSSFLLLGS